MKADLFRACLHGLVRLLRDRRGATAAIVAVTLAALIGFTGLGVETGLWYTIKRYNQSAADVAAISGAMEKAAGGAYQTDICALAKYAAKANGFTVSGSWSCPTLSPTGATGITKCTGLTSGEMCVNDPPLFGGFAGLPNYVEVILAQHLEPDRQRPAVQRLGLSRPAEVGQDPGQAVVALGRIGMVLSPHPKADRQRLAVERLGLGGPVELLERPGQATVAARGLGVILAQQLEADRQGLPLGRFGFRRPA